MRLLFHHNDIIPSKDVQHISTINRDCFIDEYIQPLQLTEPNDVQKLIGFIEQVTGISDNQVNSEAEQLLDNLKQDGWQIDGNRIVYSGFSHTADLFIEQFPVGLPFGMVKPDFAITAMKGGQSLKFELKSGIGIIWRDVYPDFDFQSFQVASGITPSTNLALKKSLLAMNQTDCEKVFFQAYAKHFGMADNHIPMLIPQAWIQWHSLPKRALKASKRSIADELYRVDFVAFWENQRYVILIDDISHYAVKDGKRWVADEESYSNRLKEDRKLQAEGWRIFRVSNWEIKDQSKIEEILVDLQRLIEF